MRNVCLLIVGALFALLTLTACESPSPAYRRSANESTATSFQGYEEGPDQGALNANGIPPAAPGVRAMRRSVGSGSFSTGSDTDADRTWLRDFDNTPADELWVIVPPDRRIPPPNDDIPRAGCLVAPRDTGFDALPLEKTNVDAHIAGMFAAVDVQQQFTNPYASKIEAVYVFPLPQDASVTGFVMTVGQRTIRAIVRERQQAEEIYYQARAAGKNASLLTQERPNIFTQRVANIDPGHRIDIDITYFHSIDVADGECEWVFPMTIGPRFTPPPASPHASRDARTRLAPRNNPSPTYVPQGVPTPHRVAINVSIDAGVPLQDVRSPSHAIAVNQQSGSWDVKLADESVVPDRDFVLRYRLGGPDPRGSLALANAGPGVDGGYFALTIMPPISANERARRPIELTFLLDRSGSMNGEPFQQATDAIDAALASLSPDDTFQIISFSEDVVSFASAPVSATHDAVARGREHLHNLKSGGGTYVLKGVESAFAQRKDRSRTRIVVLISDGLVSNEAEIIGRVHDVADDACVFSFGIGSSPNRYLMDRLARIGGGASTYIANDEDAVEPMRQFLHRVSAPAMTDVRVDFGPLRTAELTPDRVPDLWLGRPITIVGRLADRTSDIRSGVVTITGRVNGSQRRIEVPVEPALFAADSEFDCLAQVWARRRIMQLADEATYRSPAPRQRVIERLALDYGLASPFTAFVAVDALSHTSGSYGTTVEQPVPMPAGMRYDTTLER